MEMCIRKWRLARQWERKHQKKKASRKKRQEFGTKNGLGIFTDPSATAQN
jgi:hypothetical protein